MKQCPSLQQWLDFSEGRLDSTESRLLESHRTSGCADCEAQFRWVQRIRETLPATAAQGFSNDRRNYLRELAAARIAPRPQSERFWIARLLMDSRRQPTLAGARGESEAVQLRYEIPAGEVRVWAEPSGTNGWYLIGQVYATETSDFLVPDAAALTDTFGMTLYSARTEDT